MSRVFVGAQAHLLSLMSADGRRIMSDEIGAGSGRYGIYIWDVDTRAPVSLIHHPNVLYNHRAISGDGNRVVLFQDGRVSVWDVTNEQVLNLPPDVGGSPRPIDVSGDGARALIAGERDVRVIDARTGEALWHTNAPSERQQVRLSSDGRVVLLAPDQARSEAFAVDAGADRRPVRFDQPADLVAIDAIGRRAVAVSQDAAGVINLATARIWNTETGELVEEMPLAQRLHRAALGGDGTRLLLGFRDRLWTLTPNAWRRRVQELEVESDVYEAALSADGTLLAAAREGGVLQVWEADGAQPLLYLAGLDPIDALAFSLDGSTLTTAGRTARGIVSRRHPIRATTLVDEICNRVTRNLTDAEWAEHVGSGARGRSCPQHP